MTKPHSSSVRRTYNPRKKRRVDVLHEPKLGAGVTQSVIAIIFKELAAHFEATTGMRAEGHTDHAPAGIASTLIIANRKSKSKVIFKGYMLDSKLTVRQHATYINGNSRGTLAYGGMGGLDTSLALKAVFDINDPTSMESLEKWLLKRITTYVINQYISNAPPQSTTECADNTM